MLAQKKELKTELSIKSSLKIKINRFFYGKGKKFKSRAFRELLLSIQDKAMEEQKTILNETFNSWKGDLEQIDDVCVIGVRIG